MHDSSIYKHKYLYSVHADYKLRRLELKTNKITVLDNEPIKASEIIAIDRHTVVCSSLTTFSTYDAAIHKHEIRYCLAVGMQVCHTTKRQIRMKRSQMQNIRTFGCQTMIGIRVGFVPFVVNLFSIGVLAVVAICRRSIYVVGDFDIRERLADVPSILGLHCEGDNKLRAFTKSGEHFTITIKL